MSTSTRRSARLASASKSGDATLSLSAAAATAVPPLFPPGSRGRKRKTVADPTPDSVAEEEEAPTKTAKAPSKRRAAQRASTPPPPPSSSNAEMMGEPAAAPGTTVPVLVPVTPLGKKPRAAAVGRLAESDATLGTLLSPETSRVITNKKARAAARSSSLSPTKKAAQVQPAPPTEQLGVPLAANILEEANRYLISVDPRMRPIIEQHHCRTFSPEGLAEKVDPFESLCSGIISQQVSGAAAKSIKKRFVGLFYEEEDAAGVDGDVKAETGVKVEPEAQVKTEAEVEVEVKLEEVEEEGAAEAQPRRFPQPSQVVGVPLERLRTAGLSQRKAEYVSGLAQKFVDGELSAQLLADAPYDEVISRLTAVRGLGLWSAEMFAVFGLKRIDVFSLGDLGVQRGMAAFVGRDIAKLKASKAGKFKYMNEADMTELADRFRPYRSLFMWYMWRVEETDVSTME